MPLPARAGTRQRPAMAAPIVLMRRHPSSYYGVPCRLIRVPPPTLPCLRRSDATHKTIPPTRQKCVNTQKYREAYDDKTLRRTTKHRARRVARCFVYCFVRTLYRPAHLVWTLTIPGPICRGWRGGLLLKNAESDSHHHHHIRERFLRHSDLNHGQRAQEHFHALWQHNSL